MTKITVKRVAQLDAFCGPASLVTMLSQHGVVVDQKDVAKVAHAMKDIERLGMRIDQLALAIRRLAPHLAMWAKRDATMQDLDVLVNRFSLACGVEWQEPWCEEELADLKEEGCNPDETDQGHYSVITGVDLEKKQILMQNPSYYRYHKDQLLSFEEFEKQWFDTNQVSNEAPEEAKEWMHDYHVLFVIAPKSMVFPEELVLKKVRIAPTFRKRSLIERWSKHMFAKLQQFLHLGKSKTEVPTSVVPGVGFEPT